MQQQVKTTLTETAGIIPEQFKNNLQVERVIRNSNRQKLGRILSNTRKSKSIGNVVSAHAEFKRMACISIQAQNIHERGKKT